METVRSHTLRTYLEAIPQILKLIGGLALFMLILSLTIFVSNDLSLKYHLLNYFNLPMVKCLAVFILTYMGLSLLPNKLQRLRHILGGYTLYYIILALFLLLSMAVELTPYPPIDQQLVQIDVWLGFHQMTALHFANQYHWLNRILWVAYDSMLAQIIILPLILCWQQNRSRLYELLIIYLLTGLIGTLIYYYLPTLAPASQFHSGLFILQEHETGAKFYDIHHYIKPLLTDGGLISFPSFHMIWACMYLWSLRDYRYLFYPLLIVEIILAIACVLLGWHYLIDIIAGFIIFALCAWLTNIYLRKVTRTS